MFGITVSQAAAICGGLLKGNEHCNEEIRRVIIDSRKAGAGDLFVAYKGENTDGHNYIGKAFENGALCALAELIPEGVEGPVIIVPDVQDALEKIVSAFREKVNGKIVGVTGSVGKTTAKEMISAVLSEKFQVHKTSGNLNNTIGVPISVSEIEKEHEAAVIEMGINHFGEMEHLGKMAAPDIILYTMIGHAHLEFLGDLDGVLKAKTEVLPYLKKDALVMINGDDTTLKKLSCVQKILTFGMGSSCDVRATEITTEHDGTTKCRISHGSRSFNVQIPSFGKHMVYAALEGAAVGFAMGLTDEEIISGIASYHTVGRRFNVCNTGYLRLVDDCYNANPDSMKSSIASLMDLPGRHVCILGDMRELGENSPQMHAEIGAFAKKCGADLVLCCGKYAGDVARGAGEIALAYEDKEQLRRALPEVIQRNDAVLVKASLGSHLENVSEDLKIAGKPLLFLDIDDTILDFKAAERNALSKALRMIGQEPSDEILERYNKINISFWEKLERGEISRNEVLVGRFEQLFDEYGISGSPEEIMELYEQQLAIGHFFMPGALELLEELKDEYRLFLVSNGSKKVQSGRLASAGIEHYFENIFISEEMGFEKPTKEFFDCCFQKIGMFRKENSVIIGDSLTADILGGINTGIRTIWYRCRGRKPSETIIPDHTVESLLEIPPLLHEIFRDKA